MTTRSRTPEPPYHWQSKEALRAIRQSLDGDSLLPFAILTYCALTENASDKGEESFTTLQSHLARLAGSISVRTIQRVLPVLRELGVIAYTTPRLKGPITFSLLSVVTDSRNVTTESQNVTTITKTASQADNRKNKEVTKEEQEKNSPDVSSKPPTRRPSRVSLVDEDHLSELNKIYTPASVNKAVAKCKAWLLTPKGKGKAFSKNRLDVFLRDAEPLTDARPENHLAPRCL